MRSIGSGSEIGRFLARQHLEDIILPWWNRHGADDENGGVFTCFSNVGRLQSRQKYTWSQGRWAWLCAEISKDAAAGLITADISLWSTRAVDAAGFITDHAVLQDGQTAFRVDADGIPIASGPSGELSTSVFADLFAALGLSGAAGLSDCPPALKPKFRDEAETILTSASCRIRDRSARTEPYPVPRGFVDMAGPMTLLHVGAEAGELTNSSVGFEIAQAAMSELLPTGDKDAMWANGCWWEFRPDSASESDLLLARHKTPGHLLECLWMVLHAVENMKSSIDLPAWLPDLAVLALEIGWDRAYGGLLRYVDKDGGAPRGRILGNDRYEKLVQSSWDTKLWWVHVEAMYATKLLAQRFGREDLSEWHQRISDYTLDTFPDPHGNEWIQIRDRSGAPLDQVVALPVKDPFHIARTLLFLNRLDQTPEPQSKGIVQ